MVLTLGLPLSCPKIKSYPNSNALWDTVNAKMAAIVMALDARRRFRRERVFRVHSQALDTLTDDELISRYRFDRRTIMEIIQKIDRDVRSISQRGGHVIPPHLKVLVTLRYLAKRDFLSEVSDLHGISRSSVSRILPDVCKSIMRHYPIRFPRHGVADIKRQFYTIAQFPNVIGCVDGTLIEIETPHDDEMTFVCRKGFHAINVQAVVDAKMRFINIVVKWPGSTHDAFILSNSAIGHYLDTSNIGWLLGDSGYGLKLWLMTPYLQPNNQNKQAYNVAHARTRTVVERSFGVLKARFRCIDRSGGKLCFQPRKAVNLISACFSLHNLAQEKRLPVPVFQNDINDDINFIDQQQPNMRAQHIRDQLSLRF